MITINSHKQRHLFDPWGYLSPKRRKMLDESWAGLFQKQILLTLPAKTIASYFDKSMGRPTKELHTALGVLVLQQTFNLTDLETVDQFAFNIQWHYALNIPEESDAAKYMCPKTLWNMRMVVTENNLDEKIFTEATQKLVDTFKVDPSQQRMDSTHIKSNMRRLGRICLFSAGIHKFLVNLKRGHEESFQKIDSRIIDTYLSKKDLGCFSRVKPSDSRKTLDEVSKDLFDLVQQFKNCDEIKNMQSYKQLERILKEQCNLTGSDDKPVELKAPKDIPSDSLQNPSDSDVTYSGHKGQGYQVQIMETFTSQEKEKKLNLLTYVEVEPAHESDAHGLMPGVESVEERNLLPEELLVDSLYGSDENCQRAKEHSVELIAPLMGAPKAEGICLSDFNFNEEGSIISCPQGHKPVKIKIKKGRITAAFDSKICQQCPHLSQCPIKEGKKLHYLRYSDKELRIAHRRAYEKTPQFQDRYRWRAGIEGTMSEYKRRTGVGKLKVRGLKAVRYCAVLKALAINIFRATAFQKAKKAKALCISALASAKIQIILSFKELFSAVKLFFIKIYNPNDNYCPIPIYFGTDFLRGHQISLVSGRTELLQPPFSQI